MAEILDASVAELGAEEDSEADVDDVHVDNIHRVNVLTWACRFGNKRCRDLTKERLSDVDSISLDLRSAVLCGGLRDADQELWEQIRRRSLVEENSSLRSALVSALGCSENEGILERCVLSFVGWWIFVDGLLEIWKSVRVAICLLEIRISV